MTAGLPLLAARDLDAPLARARGVPISARRFLADVAAQSALLEGAAPVVNLCANRYRFAVVLAAAWTRGALALLPPNALPDTLARLHAMWPGLVLACDGGDDAAHAHRLPRLRLAPCALDTFDAPAPAGTLDDGANGNGNGADTGTGMFNDTGTGTDPGTDTFADTDVRPTPLAPTFERTLPAACLLTSGTTGAPQPHLKRWGALVRNARAGAERLAALAGLPDLAGLTLVATVPPQHSYGLESSVMLALHGGAAFDASRPFYPADIAAALARAPRPRALVTTPFHLRTLLQSPLALPPVDFVLSATAPLSPQLAREAEARFGAPMLEIYGSTETCQVASRRTAHEEVWQTFGELRIHAERTGAPGAANESAGEPDAERFWASGGHLEAPTPLADLLQLEDDRRFRLLGRAGDIVQVAGKRSSLAHLDYHLNSLPGVRDGAFWLPEDVPDAVVRTVAFVVAPGVDAAHLIAGLRERVESVFLPRRIVFLDALPRAGTGKLARDALAELARRHGAADER